ncbi:MAG TPA: molecular chaperone HtpG [Polyangiaceae bacterium]|nr:molecular chaperone HtpG [Polyangiaceae bacterium]
MSILPPPVRPTTMENTPKTTHKFQAEVTRVLGLVIHSLYKNPEVFLRELVSNASDALDKLRFRAITEPALLPAGENLEIRIIPDEASRTLTIWDNGIGMDAEALARELGTIAHSGTRAFIEKLEEAKKKDANLIGQFGVGFYSGYLVADRVEVVSRAAGSEAANRWTSDGAETFTIEPAERETQGTSVILHLKADADPSLLSGYRIRQLVRRYSDFLDHPIRLVEKDEDGKEKSDVLNQGKALWQRKPSDVTKEQYEELYKHLSHDFEPPLAYKHFHVEGTQLFSGLLYVPKRPPFDLFSPDGKHGVRLHVKRVLIMEDCEELLPKWLRFVKGVIDSEDLPLNVSREMLQDSKAVRVIQKQVVKQVLDTLGDLAKEDAAKYAEFWHAFGKVLKEGLHFDPDQKDKIAPLLRYESSKADGLTSLADYKSRMPEDQKAIYYVIAESRALAEKSPHTESLRKRGWEVLYMTDPVDSFAVENLDAWDGVPLTSATGAELPPVEGEKEKQAEQEEALKDLRDLMRRKLQDQVSEVRVSTRLTDSPACLVLPEGGLPPYMERLLRATQKDAPKTKRILEVNPDHPLVQNLGKLAAKDAESAQLGEWIELLFEQALLAEGSPVEDPARFASRLATLLQTASGAAL